jgi:hypothetical protein
MRLSVGCEIRADFMTIEGLELVGLGLLAVAAMA